MGKRGPKKGQGGRPKKTASATNPITQLHRLKKRELRARKSGHLEKAQQAQNEADELTERFEKTMTDFKATQEENAKTVENIVLALTLFHKAHLIARDPALSDAEKINLITYFNFPEDTPPYFFKVLNKLEETETKMEKKQK